MRVPVAAKRHAVRKSGFCRAGGMLMAAAILVAQEVRLEERRTQPIVTFPSSWMRHEGLCAISQMIPFGSCTCAW